MLLADHGCDADWIRELAMKKGASANIPPKSNRSDPRRVITDDAVVGSAL
jgi:hypothetical protein